MDSGAGPVLPAFDTIQDGSYAPLSRPIFIYVKTSSLERPEVVEFVNFYLSIASEIVPDVGYVALPAADYEAELARIN